MSDMVGAVARAIADAWNLEVDDWPEWQEAVRVGLHPLREPTEAMLANTVDEHGTPRILDFTSPEERAQAFLMARYSWRAMIDAALAASQP